MGSLLRILDANLNRAREALRVVEDLARFHRDDAALAASLKELRHRLDRKARPHAAELLRARDSEADVGRDGDPPVIGPRSAGEVGAANLKRAQEALRSIEEAAKGRFPSLAAEAHGTRFRLYAIEKRMADPRRLLEIARLYVLLDPSVTPRSLPRLAEEALRGGADLLQLRQKPRPDVVLAKEIRAAARDAIFIVNDDPAVAMASGADGVHLGLLDMSIARARALGAGILGATTHTLSEARRAKAQGADYVSCGPMFATALKPGLEPKGLTYLAGLKKLGVPFFCIGGITSRNVRPDFVRVAVCAGVIAAKDVAAAARAVRGRLTSRAIRPAAGAASSHARRGTGGT
jgi:thiamine-phosphate pyrophosphorylase